MDYEDAHVFSYVQRLLEGQLKCGYTISEFAKKHSPISAKLKELKYVVPDDEFVGFVQNFVAHFGEDAA